MQERKDSRMPDKTWDEFLIIFDDTIPLTRYLAMDELKWGGLSGDDQSLRDQHEEFMWQSQFK